MKPRIVCPARKGDIVAVQITRTSTAVNMRTTVHLECGLGVVERADRHGEVKTLKLAGTKDLATVGHRLKVWTIKQPRLQAAAKQIFDGAPGTGLVYPALDPLRRLIEATADGMTG